MIAIFEAGMHFPRPSCLVFVGVLLPFVDGFHGTGMFSYMKAIKINHS